MSYQLNEAISIQFLHVLFFCTGSQKEKEN